MPKCLGSEVFGHFSTGAEVFVADYYNYYVLNIFFTLLEFVICESILL